MENIAQKLRKAYDLLLNADTTDIDAYYLAVEEAHGFIAEALDMVDNPDSEPMFVDDGKTRFYLDDEQVSAEVFNEFYYAHDTGWCEDFDEDGTLLLTIHTDDARS
jgi:hypothetical protein